MKGFIFDCFNLKVVFRFSNSKKGTVRISADALPKLRLKVDLRPALQKEPANSCPGCRNQGNVTGIKGKLIWILISFNVNPETAFYLNVDPVPGSQTNADPDPGQTLK
jgi:hypothetical protein